MNEVEIQRHELSEPPPKWFRYLFNRYTLILFILGSLVIAPFAYRGFLIAQVPYTDEPFDLEEFGTVEIEDGENAAVDYKEAATLLFDRDRRNFSDDDIKKMDEILDGGTWALATPKIVEWLEKNQKALKRWEIGTEKPDYLFMQPKQMSFSTFLDGVDDLRIFERLAILQGKKMEAEERFHEALESYLSLFRSSRHTGRNGCIVERIVGSALHLRASSAIMKWSNFSSVDIETIKRAKSEIEMIYATTEKPSSNVKCEYLSAKNFLNDPGEELQYLIDSENQYAQYLYHFLFGEPDFSLELYKHVAKNWLDHVDHPKHKRAPFFVHPEYGGLLFDNSIVVTSESTPLSNSEIAGYFENAVFLKSILGNTSSLIFMIDKERTRQGLLLLVLSVEAYKRDHEKYPPDLQTLIDGEYLDSIPLDAMQSTKVNLKYRNDEECVAVYSLGEDGVDNGGCLAGFNSSDPDYGYVIESREKQSTN